MVLALDPADSRRDSPRAIVVHGDPEVAREAGGAAVQEPAVDAALLRVREAIRQGDAFGVAVIDLDPIPDADVAWAIHAFLALDPTLHVLTLGAERRLGPLASHPRVTAIADRDPRSVRRAVRRALERRRLRTSMGRPAPPTGRDPTARRPTPTAPSTAEAGDRGLIEGLLTLLSDQLEPDLQRIADGLAAEADAPSPPQIRALATAARRLHERLAAVQDLCRAELGHDDVVETRFSLRRLITGVVEELAAGTPPRRADILIEDLPAPDAHFVGAERHIARILRALLDNALRHGRPPTAVAVTLHDRHDGRVNVRFRVEDAGPGIPSADVPRIFNRFVRLEGAAAGMGVGLTLAKDLTERLGGRVGVMSAEGMGSTFWFEVPLRRAPAPREPEPAELPVLVVEDDPVNRMVVTRILEREGYAVDTADDGPEAIAKALERRYAVILMDVRLPTMDGLEATEEIRRAEPPGGWRNEIVALTAHATPEYHDRCRAAGMDGYMTKPVRKAQLLSLMRAAQRRAAERLSGSP